jgi:cytosine/adenosine deaminase-related metal-dependent hydrolase
MIGETISLPALATAHSHAFQRALRGDTQRPGPAGLELGRKSGRASG